MSKSSVPNEISQVPIDSMSDRTANHSREPGFQDHEAKFDFPIIGIGASAGGLESLEQLFAKIPSDSNAAFVIVQHLSPDFKSMMDEILSRRTKMKVRRIESGMQVNSKTVYLITPNADLEIVEDKLYLRERKSRQGVNQPIDRFFTSLANCRGPACAAIILSGSGSDGSRGIRDICDSGGMVLAEDPASARFDGMPKSAIETGTVDFTGSISQIATWLARFLNSFQKPIDSGRFVDPSCQDIQSDAASAVKQIFELLRSKYQINFSQYKPKMILRRIERRSRLMHFTSIDQYVQRLETEPKELAQLYRDLLIGVTRFFRDAEAFEILSEKVFPEIIDEAQGRALRIWASGCATGEEAYSLTITLLETMRKLSKHCDIKVFATDAHRQSLDKAASGVYTQEEVEGISAERLATYFQRIGDSYHVNQSVRKLIVFAPQNLLNDASFTNLDLAVCRNTLIYFGDEGQRRALSLMHFGLRVGGFLFLGPSETPGDIITDYSIVDRRWKIYRKISALKAGAPRVKPIERIGLQGNSTTNGNNVMASSIDQIIIASMETLATEYIPPTFITDADFKLLYSTPGSDQFLRQQEGRFGTTLPDLVLPALKASVLVGLQQCMRQSNPQIPIVLSRVAIPREEVDQIKEPSWSGDPNSSASPIDNQLMQIKFRQLNWGKLPQKGFSISIILQTPTDASLREKTSSSEFEMVAQSALEEELRTTKESLQSTIEQLETSNEELQAINEDMAVSNEELQSTNEELSSVNQELLSVNAQYLAKIEELVEISEDMENFFRSTNMVTLFLDHELRIRRMTPKAAEFFGLTADDTGRRLDNFRNPLQGIQLYDLIRDANVNQQLYECKVFDLQGKRLLLRLLPYVSSRKLNGTVLTIVNP